MSNKLFFSILALLVLPFFVWMIYDSTTASADLRRESPNRDVLLDNSGSMAQVQYSFNFATPVYSHDLSTSQIERISQSSTDGERYHVYGLTQADFGSGTHYQVNWSKKWFKEEYEMWIDGLRVDFSYNTVNVFVTNAYPEGSCEYQATLDHENQHVEIHKRMFAQYQKILRETLDKSQTLPLAGRPIVVPSIEEGKKRVGDMLSAVLDPVMDRFKTDLATEQGKIDTPDSYNELRQRCQHW